MTATKVTGDSESVTAERYGWPAREVRHNAEVERETIGSQGDEFDGDVTDWTFDPMIGQGPWGR